MQNINPLTGQKPEYIPNKKSRRTVSKHQASKKGHKHVKNPSRGELNHQKFLGK